MHITDVTGPHTFAEFHLCEECYQKFLHEPSKMTSPATPEVPLLEDVREDAPTDQCEICGIRFVEFRNSGRLGCPHDYQLFGTQLNPLLESIHGDTQHRGKTPQRLPAVRQLQQELSNLRKLLSQAVSSESYEEAARLRDRIRELESSVDVL
jgi:protein arginine kinase activator